MTALRRALVVVVGLIAVGVVGGAVAALLAFGPSGASAPAERASGSGVVARSEASAAAPADFRDRPTFRSCGSAVLGQGDRIPPERVECLASTPGEGRELVVVTTTTEGDPIVRYYRTGPGLDGVEIFEDATADRFGGGWHRSDCRSGRIDQSGACA